jgi:NADPH-dependent 2,4-dienoyl-CoA reductase/sulfur reductase-like enzyme
MEKIKSICVMRELFKALSELETRLMEQYGVSLNEAMALCCIGGDTLTASVISENTGLSASHTSLATEAGLEIGEMRGIKVNDYLQTSDEHIYAVGDAIEFRHPLTDRPWLNYLAGPANRQARIVADNMVFGNKVTYEGAVGTSIAKIFDMTVAASGFPAKRFQTFTPFIG